MVHGIEAASEIPQHIPPRIDCVDCGGICHLLSMVQSEDDGTWIVAYRCEDCMDRWDLEFDDADTSDSTYH